MRQALSVLPAEKRAELLPEISPIDVLVVGKDTQSKAKSRTDKAGTSFALKHSRSLRTTRRSPPLHSIASDFTLTRSRPVTIGS